MKVNPLSKDFSIKSLLGYTLPSIFMMIFMSTYTIIDGVFVAQMVGEDALAAINIVFPLFGIVFAVALMFSTGGNAIIARFLGEGKEKEANQFFTVLYIVGGILGVIISTLGFLFPEKTLSLLGASDDLFQYTKDYMLSLCFFVTTIIFQVFAQTFFVTAGKPMYGFIVSVLGGITNIILDYIFIAPNIGNLGIAGAGFATGIGNSIPGIIGLFYFTFNKKSVLKFVKPKINFKLIWFAIYNGMSELVNSLALSITTIMFNFILMGLAGDAGVAAISVILYIQQFQTSIYFGYTMGVSPIISYKFGERNTKALRKLVKQSFIIISASSIMIIVATLLFVDEAVSIFITKSSPTFNMAKTGLVLFMPSYLFMGFNIFITSMFTALSNGKISATLSICRSLIFIVLMLIILPYAFGINGVWLAIPVAEMLAIGLGIYAFKRNKTIYGY